MSSRHPLLANERGAVFAEKLAALLPLLLAFFAVWELMELATARLLVSRASSAAGRAASVVLADHPHFYDGDPIDELVGRRKRDVELAAGMILSASPQLADDYEVRVSRAPTGFGSLRVAVHVSYRCAFRVLCGLDGIASLEATSEHAYQGARYRYEPFESSRGVSAVGSRDSARAKLPPSPCPARQGSR